MPPRHRAAERRAKQGARLALRLAQNARAKIGSPSPFENMRSASPPTPQENFPTLKGSSARENSDPDLMESSTESLRQQQDELNAELTGLAFEKLTAGETCSQQQYNTKEDKLKEIRKKLAAIGRELQLREGAKSPTVFEKPCTCKNCHPSKLYLDGLDEEPHRDWLISGRG